MLEVSTVGRMRSPEKQILPFFNRCRRENVFQLHKRHSSDITGSARTIVRVSTHPHVSILLVPLSRLAAPIALSCHKMRKKRGTWRLPTDDTPVERRRLQREVREKAATAVAVESATLSPVGSAVHLRGDSIVGDGSEKEIRTSASVSPSRSKLGNDKAGRRGRPPPLVSIPGAFSLPDHPQQRDQPQQGRAVEGHLSRAGSATSVVSASRPSGEGRWQGAKTADGDDLTTDAVKGLGGSEENGGRRRSEDRHRGQAALDNRSESSDRGRENSRTGSEAEISLTRRGSILESIRQHQSSHLSFISARSFRSTEQDEAEFDEAHAVEGEGRNMGVRSGSDSDLDEFFDANDSDPELYQGTMCTSCSA